MAKYISLQIKEPCHENWDHMSPSEQGKYCNSCQKSVVDFTNMTDTQLANYFKLNTGNTCGRFYDDQLNQTIAIPRKEIPWLKYFFTITLPAFLFSLKATAQKKVDSKKTELTSLKITTSNDSYMNGGYKIYDSTSCNDTSKNKIMGEVWNKPNSFEKSKILPFKNIKVKNILKQNYNDFLWGKVTSNPKTEICEKEEKITNRPKEQMNQLFGAVSIVRNNKVFFTIPDFLKPKVKTNTLLNIYPNPAPKNFFLNLSFANDLIGDINLEIFSVSGNLIKKETRTFNVKIKNTFITTNNLVKGYYICRVTDVTTNEQYSSSFIVE